MAKKAEGTAPGTPATPAIDEANQAQGADQTQTPPAVSDNASVTANAETDAKLKVEAEAEAAARAQADQAAAGERARADAEAAAAANGEHGEQLQSDPEPRKLPDTFPDAMHAQIKLAHEEKRFADEAALQVAFLSFGELKNKLVPARDAALAGGDDALARFFEHLHTTL